jgi:hypothetical protein
MARVLEPLPAATQAELAKFLRRQAEECLQLARGQPMPVATELLSLAAMLHERAVRLESGRSGAPSEEVAG